MDVTQAKVLSIEKRSSVLGPFLKTTFRLDSGNLMFDCFALKPHAKWKWDQFQRARKGRRVGLVIRPSSHGFLTIKRYVPPETLGDTAKSWVAYFIRGYLLPWLEKDI